MNSWPQEISVTDVVADHQDRQGQLDQQDRWWERREEKRALKTDQRREIPFPIEDEEYDSDGWEVASEDDPINESHTKSNKRQSDDESSDGSSTDDGSSSSSDDENESNAQASSHGTGEKPMQLQSTSRSIDLSGQSKKKLLQLVRPFVNDANNQDVTSMSGAGPVGFTEKYHQSVTSEFPGSVIKSQMGLPTSTASKAQNLPHVVSISTSNNTLNTRKREERPVFNCHLCFESFIDPDLLAQHVANHSENTRIMCEFCSKTFIQKRYLTDHLKRVHRIFSDIVPKTVIMHQDDIVKQKPDGVASTKHSLSSSLNCTRAPHKCLICSQSFQARKDLDSHMKTCKVVKPAPVPKKWVYKCPICSNTFKEKRYVLAHAKRVHKKKKMVASDIKKKRVKVKESKNVNNTKMKTDNSKQCKVTKNNQLVCPICSREFKLEHNLRNHLRRVHGKELPVHLQNTARNQESRKSPEKATPEQTIVQGDNGYWACPICSEHFTSKRLLQKHIPRVHDVNSVAYMDQVQYTVKVAIKLLYRCNTCSQSFFSSFLLKEHKSKEHNNVQDDKSFQCSYCLKSFGQEIHCLNHIQTHSKPFQCRICGKGFMDNEQCLKHEQTHTDVYDTAFPQNNGEMEVAQEVEVGTDSMVQAEQMNDSCTSNTLIGAHKIKQEAIGDMSEYNIKPEEDTMQFQNSTNEKGSDGNAEETHVCEYCMRSFDRSYQLAKHILSHTDEDPYQCSECFKIFYLEGSLMKHMEKFHGGGRICRICKGTMPLKGNRKKEICERCRGSSSGKSHVKEAKSRIPKSYSCETCNKTFNKRRTFSRHMKERHVKKVPKNTHKCIKCKKYVPNANLIKHAMTHVEANVYFQCSSCTETFPDVDLLTDHGISAHGMSMSCTIQSSYKCQVCSESLADIMAAKKHVFDL